MLHKTKGIVFQQTQYSETSLILKIYTADFGLQSYIVKGIRSKNSKTRLALFQPLNLLDLVVYHRENKTINFLREVKVDIPYQSIQVDMLKRSILLFLNELLVKSIKEESANKPLFDWLYHSLTWLDLSEKNLVNFHLIFMVQLTRMLGFYPKKSVTSDLSIFDLREGQFVNKAPEHPEFISGETATQFADLLKTTLETPANLQINTADRRKLLDALVVYYRLHIPGFTEMKSVKVLKEILE
jgi:DNA repair protein RecO (recombination protein O)